MYREALGVMLGHLPNVEEQRDLLGHVPNLAILKYTIIIRKQFFFETWLIVYIAKHTGTYKHTLASIKCKFHAQ